MSRTTVLVGFAEAMSAPEVVWSLVDGGFHVVAFARKGRPSALRHSRHVTCHDICPPEVNPEASLSDLRGVLASMENNNEDLRHILFPLDDKAVWLASQAKPEKGWLFAGPQGANAELALDKWLQVEAALEAGFDVPTSVLARNVGDVFRFAADQAFPMILKPAECVPMVQGRVQNCQNWVCANSRELQRATAEWAERVPLLVQPFL